MENQKSRPGQACLWRRGRPRACLHFPSFPPGGPASRRLHHCGLLAQGAPPLHNDHTTALGLTHTDTHTQSCTHTALTDGLVSHPPLAALVSEEFCCPHPVTSLVGESSYFLALEPQVPEPGGRTHLPGAAGRGDGARPPRTGGPDGRQRPHPGAQPLPRGPQKFRTATRAVNWGGEGLRGTQGGGGHGRGVLGGVLEGRLQGCKYALTSPRNTEPPCGAAPRPPGRELSPRSVREAVRGEQCGPGVWNPPAIKRRCWHAEGGRGTAQPPR